MEEIRGQGGYPTIRPVARWMTSAPLFFISCGTYSTFPPGATHAGGKSDQFHIFPLIPLERSLAVAKCPKTFAPGAGPVPVANDNSQID